MTDKQSVFQWRTKRMPYLLENEWTRYVSEERKQASRQLNLNDVFVVKQGVDGSALVAACSFREFDILCEYSALLEHLHNGECDLARVTVANSSDADVHNVSLCSVDLGWSRRTFLVCMRDIAAGESIKLDVTCMPTHSLSQLTPSEPTAVSSSDESALLTRKHKQNHAVTGSVMVMPGVQVRNLSVHHLLNGQQGLFATRSFATYDLVGEYTGRVVPEGCGGSYCAALENKPARESLGVDASECGNEARFINCYFNLAPEANLVFRTAYVDTYPRLLLVCTRPVECGTELLLDYGDAYIAAYLTPRPRTAPLSTSEMRQALPMMLDSDDSCDSGSDCNDNKPI